MVTWYLALLALLGAERIGELLLSRRNAAVLAAHGAIEVGQRHFRVMKLLHTAFFVACAAEIAVARPAGPPPTIARSNITWPRAARV
jgi:methyltransferase